MLLNCDFIIVPRIILTDNNLSQTDKLLIGLIISLTLKNGYCFASNNYLAISLNVSKRTITYSLTKLKKENYIRIKGLNNSRKIYLNNEKVPIKNSHKYAKGCNRSIEENCDYNIKKKYKINIPNWIKNPKLCEEEKATKQEIEELTKILNKRKDNDVYN